MANIYEEVKLTEMDFNEQEQIYYYNCPCGDLFTISMEELMQGVDIAPCNSCSLQIKVSLMFSPRTKEHASGEHAILIMCALHLAGEVSTTPMWHVHSS